MPGENGYSSSSAQNAARRVAQLHTKLAAGRDDIVLTKTYDTEDCDILIVATGAVTRAARTAALEARAKGLKVGVIQLLTVWPFPDKEILEAARNARSIVVPEMNYSGQMAGEVLKLVCDKTVVKRVNSYNGQIMTPADIAQAIH